MLQFQTERPDQEQTFYSHHQGTDFVSLVGLGMNVASPPETPHQIYPGQWNYDVSDDMIHTPGYNVVSGEMQLGHPHYVSPSMTSQADQPDTPHIGYFPHNNAFGQNHGSPQFDVQSVDNNNTEWPYPQEGRVFVGSLSSSPQANKGFVFHNMTVNDYANKGSPREASVE